MCIIVFAPEGVQLPRRAIIEECWYSNRDGAGYMWREPDGIHIHKGFMTLKAFIDDIEATHARCNLTDTDVVLHFRVGTSGKKDSGRCHPFPLSEKIDHLCAPKIISSAGIVHNGIISDLVKEGSDLSDTQYLVKKLCTEGIDAGLDSLPATAGKIIVLTKDETILHGRFIRDEKVLYSNASYIPPRYTYTRYTSGSGLYSEDYAQHKSKYNVKQKKGKWSGLTKQEEKDEIKAIANRQLPKPLSEDERLNKEDSAAYDNVLRWFPVRNDGTECDGDCDACDEMNYCNYLADFRAEVILRYS